MEYSAILHDMDKRFCYAIDKDLFVIRVQVKKDDIKEIILHYEDKYIPLEWKDTRKRIPMKKVATSQFHDYYEAQLQMHLICLRYYFEFTDMQGEKVYYGNYEFSRECITNRDRMFDCPQNLREEEMFEVPEWAANKVVYQIFPSRFAASQPIDKELWYKAPITSKDNLHGDLRGIMDHLDHIQKLGIDVMYLTPIFKATSSHKYDTIDYFIIDPEFGTNERFEKLVKEAHQRGIRIMLDAVFNHCGYQHPFWQDVLMHGKESKYYDYFYILDADKPIFDGQVLDGVPQEIPREELNYRTFAYTPTMPKWNTGNPEVREYLLEAACFWTEKYHIDGWRLDVSNEVPHDFWREFRKRVKDRNPELYILGENWDNSLPWLMGDQFDAVMNYEFAMPIWKYFRKEKEGERIYSEEQFRYAIGRLLTSYPKNVTANLFNLLESHDTERILNRAGQDVSLVKLAYLFMFIFPGTPCVYYGGEIGMGGGEHSNRQCMIWEKEKQNRELFEFISRMIELRKKYDSFCSTELQWINSENSLALKKEGAKETLYVFMQKEGKTQEYVLPEELKEKCCMECISGKMVKLGKSIRLERNGYQMYLIFKETE